MWTAIAKFTRKSSGNGNGKGVSCRSLAASVHCSKIKAAGVEGVGSLRIEAGAALGERGAAGACCPALGTHRSETGYNGGDGGWCVVMMVAYYITI